MYMYMQCTSMEPPVVACRPHFAQFAFYIAAQLPSSQLSIALLISDLGLPCQFVLSVVVES